MPRRSLPVRLAAIAFTWLVLRVALVAAGGDTGEGVHLRIRGHDVSAVVFRGAVPARTLVVASHGGLASKESLLSICWEARRRGADCVIADALGHGASGPLPDEDVVGAMRRALRVDDGLGRYQDVRYVGHSMGAYLGCGAVYGCERSVAMGQRVPCGEQRIVWGTVHRSLGLSDAFYMPVSHLLEPWTPSVVDETVSRILPPMAGARAAITWKLALAWGSLLVMLAFGVVVARALRESALSPLGRGLLGAAVFWCALALGSWRTAWFLVPTQASDALMIGAVVLPSVAVAFGVRWIVRWAFLGAAVAWVVSEAAALLAWRAIHLPLVTSLLVLLPVLALPLGLLVAAWERLSRGSKCDVVESAAFCSALLGSFLALLLPGVPMIPH